MRTYNRHDELLVGDSDGMDLGDKNEIVIGIVCLLGLCSLLDFICGHQTRGCQSPDLNRN